MNANEARTIKALDNSKLNQNSKFKIKVITN